MWAFTRAEDTIGAMRARTAMCSAAISGSDAASAASACHAL